MKKLIILADIKEYLPQLDKEEISTSRFAEILNEIANNRLGKYPHHQCDEYCYYHCTKGGTQDPDCINKNLYSGEIKIMTISEIKKEFGLD